VTWAYRLATLLLLGGILWGVRDLVSERRRGEDEAARAPGVSLVSGSKAPEASSKVRVTFLFKAPHAQSVSVAGSFNDWDAAKDPMSRGKDGEWVLQMDLAPGRYEYQFVVDGTQFVPDPNALEEREDGLGNANAVLRL
jgi:1,4-alpha-glucan branching enzyme